MVGLESGCEILALLGGDSETNHLPPCRVSFDQEPTWIASSSAIASDPEMVTDGTEGFQKALSVVSRLEPAHRPLKVCEPADASSRRDCSVVCGGGAPCS